MIKTSILSAVLMTSALLGTQANAGLINPFESAKISSQAVKDVYAGVKFNYYNQEDRLTILKDFLKTVELEYSLLPLKKELVGLDYAKLKADAIAAEEAVEDIYLSSADKKNAEAKEKVAFLQAQSNMEFLDRMVAVVAQFKDTHFGIYEKISRPFIYTGVRLFRIDGKVVVGSLENKFLGMASKLSGADLSSIRIGDEVISIDGVPVEEKVKELKAYISGSTDEFVDSQAVRSLMLRNVKYEKKNYMRVVFKNAGAMKLPIFSNTTMSETPRVDALTYLKKFDVQTDDTSIGLSFDQTTKKWNDSNMSYAGYGTKNLAKNLKGVSEYLGDNGSAAIRTGYFLNKGKTYAVMQVMTFSVANVKKGNEALTFIDALRNFVMEAKEAEVPLILDLRVNNGGNGSYPAKLLAMLAPEKAEYANSTMGLRMTQYIRQLNEGQLYQRVVAEDENEGMTIDMLNQLIDNAIADRADYTPMYIFGSPITTDPKVGGFNNKIVALVTADCISACDKTAFLIKSSGVAKIIGTHSNGTGAGFYSTSELNTEWSDRLKVFSSTLPNYVFGKPGAAGTMIFGENSVSELCSENKPTIADIQYNSKMLDLTKDNLGWLQKAAQVLEESK